MSDTLTAAPSADVVAPTVEAAGAALKSAASWADVPGIPSMDGMAVTDGDEAEGGTTAVTPDAVAEPVVEGDAPEFVQNEHGQWHRPDGTFANAEEIAQITAQLAETQPVTEAVVEPPKEIPTVTLRRRDGTTRDVQVDDPELADEIRTNFNDGMRKKEYVEKVAAVEARLAEFQQLDALLEKNPEAVILQSLTPEKEISIATALLAKHFDALIPIIQGYDTNPSQRIADTAAAQRRMREQTEEFNTYTASQKQAAAVRGAVETLIPETVPPETAEQFWADAGMDLQRAIARGEKVDPSTVPALLSHRMKLYGFDAPAGSVPAPSMPRITAAPSVPASPSPVAVPANDAAKTMAATKATQNRIKLTQRNRANAAAVPPVGAGAAPVRLPPVPAGASIEDAARAMKKIRSWAS